MRRVLIIGSPGAGKSTLAKALAARTGLPLVHLDDLYWDDLQRDAGWVRVPRELWLERLAGALAGEYWIVDGNYNTTLPLRLHRADTVILLTLPRELCVWRVVWRELSGVHPHMTGPGRRWPRAEFLRYTWDFPQKVPGMLEQIAASKPEKFILLRSAAEIRAFLRGLD